MAIPFRDRISCTVAEAVAATGISRSALYLAMKDKRVEYTQWGERRLVHVSSLLRLIEPQASQPPGSPAAPASAAEHAAA